MTPAITPLEFEQPQTTLRLMRLLLSVISVTEAVAIAELADIVDLKDPSKGALGAPDPAIVYGVKKALGETVPLSAALGDAGPDHGVNVALAKTMADAGADYVKIAFNNFSQKMAVETLASIRDSIDPNVRLIAVVYVDRAEYGAMGVFDAAQAAREACADGILLDTYYKNGKSLLDHLSREELTSIVRAAKKLGLITALAGSLGVDHLSVIRSVNPNFVGFRSAITKTGVRGQEGVSIARTAFIKEKLAFCLT